MSNDDQYDKGQQEVPPSRYLEPRGAPSPREISAPRGHLEAELNGRLTKLLLESARSRALGNPPRSWSPHSRPDLTGLLEAPDVSLACMEVQPFGIDGIVVINVVAIRRNDALTLGDPELETYARKIQDDKRLKAVAGEWVQAIAQRLAGLLPASSESIPRPGTFFLSLVASNLSMGALLTAPDSVGLKAMLNCVAFLIDVGIGLPQISGSLGLTTAIAIAGIGTDLRSCSQSLVEYFAQQQAMQNEYRRRQEETRAQERGGRNHSSHGPGERGPVDTKPARGQTNNSDSTGEGSKTDPPRRDEPLVKPGGVIS